MKGFMMRELGEASHKSALNFKTSTVPHSLPERSLPSILFTLLFIQYTTIPALNWYQWLLWLHLPIIMTHEFEEYILAGGFKDFINKKTIASPADAREDTPRNEACIFLVNPS